MKIEKYKKVGSNKYKVYGEDTEFILYEDVILKHNLLRKDSINISELESMLEDNKFYEIYEDALKYLSIKLRSKSEIENYLLKKEYEIELINNVIEKFYENGLINDKQYIEAFINDSVNLKNDGPYKIKNNLINLGFDEYFIDSYLNNIDKSIWEEKISNLVNKQNKKNNKYSINFLKQKMMNDLYLKGYDKEMILYILDNIDNNDEENLPKEYEKAYIKYSKKYKGTYLKQKIIDYLQKRGFEYSKIKNILDDNFEI